MSEESPWKEKYLQELNAAEYREQQWQHQRRTLERMLARISHALKGQTGELDQILDKVQDGVRDQSLNDETWKTLQSQIDRQITLLDQRESAPVALESGALNLSLDAERMRFARRVGSLLDQILGEVPLGTDTENKARALQQTLLYSNDWDSLRYGLREVSELVMLAISHCRVQFDDFIQQLDQRLVVLQQSFVAHTSAQSGRLSASEALGRDLRGGIKMLGQHIQSSTNLNHLKHSVTRHLDDISQSVTAFRERESEREKALAAQLETMQQKIVSMETESELMRGQILKERKRANTDMLTQLPNRDAWQERLLIEVERWQRYDGDMTVAVVDIDYFKRINDSFGHKAGDRVLQLLARELKKGLRATDFIARIGGEEFVILLPETNGEQAKKVVDGLRNRVAKLPFHFSNQPVTVTFSAGLASVREGDNEDSLFERADRTLYMAKSAGRNLVMISAE